MDDREFLDAVERGARAVAAEAKRKNPAGVAAIIKEVLGTSSPTKEETGYFEWIEQDQRLCKMQGLGVAPHPYERLAIGFRKTKRLEQEVAILELYARQDHAPGAGPQKLAARLVRAKELLAKQRAATS